MTIRTTQNFSSYAGAKITEGKPFSRKSYGRYLDGNSIDPRGNVLTGAFSPSLAGDPSDLDSSWRVPAPASDTRKVYLDGVNGLDTNSGLSPELPRKTWNSARSLIRSGYSDWLLMKVGTSMDSINLPDLPSGRSPEEPTLIGFYGTGGARPIAYRVNGSNHAFLNGRQNICFVGIEIGSKFDNPYNPYFKWDRMDYSGRSRYKGSAAFNNVANANISFIDCRFAYGHLNIQDQSQAVTAGPFFLHRCIFTGGYIHTSAYHFRSRPSNMYVHYISGIYLSECTLDSGGWNPAVPGAAGNMYNHNLYFQYQNDGDKMEMVDSLCMNAAAHGVQFRSGGLVENNFFFRNAVGISMGNTYRTESSSSYYPLEPGTRCHMYNNVLHQGRVMRVGDAACTGGNTCSGALWGLDMCPNNRPGENSDYQMHGNIVSQLAPQDKFPFGGFVNREANTNDPLLVSQEAGMSQNHYYKHTTDTEGTSEGYPDPDRSLESYLASKGYSGATAEDFCRTVTDRPVGSWNPDFMAPAINDYFRAGFGQTKVPYSWP